MRWSTKAPRRNRAARRAREEEKPVAKPGSAPRQVVLAKRQVAEALAGDLEHRVGDRGLHRRAAVVAHTDEPVRRREELNVDLKRILVDARHRKLVEVVLRDRAVLDVAG